MHWVHDRHRLVLSGFPPRSISDLGLVLSAVAPVARDKPLTGEDRFSVLIYEPYWMLGGLLFAVLALGFQWRTRLPAEAPGAWQ